MRPARTLAYFCILLSPLWAKAETASVGTKVHQRFSFGGYAATERYTVSEDGSNSNDFAVMSARYYLRAQDWNEGRWEFVTDLRDKHDFFDKLDAERLTLTSHNDFQVRQLSLHRPNLNGFFSPQVGRFAIPEAGSVFVDGGQAETRWTRGWRTSVFGGLNPKQESQSYLQFDSKANVFGANATLQDTSRGWNKNLYWSNAVVQKSYDNHVDRRYLFENINYQWNASSRILALGYLDFVPRTNVQTANLIWQDGLGQYVFTDLDLLAVDAIEYSRRRSVLETLPPNPYKQASLTVSLRPDSRTRFYGRGTSGIRGQDKKSKTEGLLGWTSSGVLSPKWDFRLSGGTRRNFTSSDVIAKVGAGYFSRKWETGFDLDYEIQKNDNGKTLHPLITELSLAHYHSRRTYSTLAFLRAADEDKTILTVFFRIGFQFSNQEVPPVRDGAPPRGAL
jgi:hypothetical protein